MPIGNMGLAHIEEDESRLIDVEGLQPLFNPSELLPKTPGIA
tara:strand:+ start:560 stop:685 length:126 start_codon:yes stop_codon:yes gene_type:complete